MWHHDCPPMRPSFERRQVFHSPHLLAKFPTESSVLSYCGSAGEPMQKVVILVFSVLGGTIVALIFSWPVALVALACLPLMASTSKCISTSQCLDMRLENCLSACNACEGGMALQSAIMLGTQKSGAGAADIQASALVGETLGAMRTVASL
eukprot:scaffold3900_cov202-Prasinococcus_capsulatus_cf.AAC.1